MSKTEQESVRMLFQPSRTVDLGSEIMIIVRVTLIKPPGGSQQIFGNPSLKDISYIYLLMHKLIFQRSQLFQPAAQFQVLLGQMCSKTL